VDIIILIDLHVNPVPVETWGFAPQEPRLTNQGPHYAIPTGE
jgi:hypothetical protein